MDVQEMAKRIYAEGQNYSSTSRAILKELDKLLKEVKEAVDIDEVDRKKLIDMIWWEAADVV